MSNLLTPHIFYLGFQTTKTSVISIDKIKTYYTNRGRRPKKSVTSYGKLVPIVRQFPNMWYSLLRVSIN